MACSCGRRSAAAVRPSREALATLPDTLERGEHLDLGRRGLEWWLTRIGLLVLLAISAAGLANVFGQEPTLNSARAEAAELRIEAPAAMRSGLIYQVKFTIEASEHLEQPALVLDPGWFEGFTINTFQPDPLQWAQRGGRNILTYGRIPAGEHLVVRLQYQVNPTTFGRRSQNVLLENEERPVLLIRRTATVFP